MEHALWSLFQFISVDDVILALNLLCILDGLERIILGVIWMWDDGLLLGLQRHPNPVAVVSPAIDHNVVHCGSEFFGKMS